MLLLHSVPSFETSSLFTHVIYFDSPLSGSCTLLNCSLLCFSFNSCTANPGVSHKGASALQRDNLDNEGISYWQRIVCRWEHIVKICLLTVSSDCVRYSFSRESGLKTFAPRYVTSGFHGSPIVPIFCLSSFSGMCAQLCHYSCIAAALLLHCEYPTSPLLSSSKLLPTPWLPWLPSGSLVVLLIHILMVEW